MERPRGGVAAERPVGRAAVSNRGDQVRGEGEAVLGKGVRGKGKMERPIISGVEVCVDGTGVVREEVSGWSHAHL